MRLPKLPLCLVACACVALPVTAQTPFNPSDPPIPVLQLDPVIVTATRTEEPALDTPYSVAVLDQNILWDRMVRSLPEALERIPGVFVQKTAHGQGSPFIRGFTGFRNLVLIDGIRLNNSIFREGPNQYWNTIDPLAVERLELVKGQGSVLYGSDAIGGTLQIFSKGPQSIPSPATGSPLVGRAFARYASGERSWIGRIEGNANPDSNAGFHLGVSGKSFGDIEAAGLGRLPYTGYAEWDIDTKNTFNINANTILTLAHQQVHQNDVWRVHRTVFAVPWRGSTVGSERERRIDQDRYLSYAQLSSAPSGANIQNWIISLSHQRQKEEQHRVRSDKRSDDQGARVDTYGLWGQADLLTPVGEVVLGASYYLDRVSTFRREFDSGGSLTRKRIQGPVADDSRYHLAGAFVSNHLESKHHPLALDVGARYTYAKAVVGEAEDPVTGAPISFTDSWNNVVGSGRATLRLDKDGTTMLFGGASQAFRAPNLSDLSRLDTSRSDEIETPSPDLSPERFSMFELGLRSTHSRWGVEGSFYYTDINSLIVRTPTGRVIDGDFEVTKRNAGDGYVKGFEIQGDIEILPGWTLFGDVAWQDGEVDQFPTSDPVSVREPLSRIHPVAGHVGLRWDAADGRKWIETLVTMAATADKLNTRDSRDTQRIPPGGTPGYTLVSLRGGWQVTDSLLLTAAVENIGDVEYRVHGSGQNEPGINAVFGLELTF
ncbi:MAG: TonB-dependent receptor [Verrucomicrobiota bacterium]